MSNRSEQLYLQDIIIAIRKIERYTKGLTLENFQEDEKTIDAIIRNLEILGEAAKNLPEAFRRKHHHIPWREIIALRNKAIHEYFGIDAEILWQTMQTDIPLLKKQLKTLRPLSRKR